MPPPEIPADLRGAFEDCEHPAPTPTCHERTKTLPLPTVFDLAERHFGSAKRLCDVCYLRVLHGAAAYLSVQRGYSIHEHLALATVWYQLMTDRHDFDQFEKENAGR